MNKPFLVFIFLLSTIYGLYEEFVEIDRVKLNLVNTALRFKFEGSVKNSALYLNPLYQLAADNHVVHLELSTSQGFWRSDLFGPAKYSNFVSGVQIIASFEDGYESNFHWKRLVSQLNGLLCTAVLSIGGVLHAKPTLSTQYWSRNQSNLFYGAFTGDGICTENIDSFKKLLPCQNSGFTRLLGSPKYLYETKFTTAGISVDRIDGNWHGEVLFSFLMPIGGRGTKFSSIFGSTLSSTCPVADNSYITVDGESKSVKNNELNATNRDWNVKFGQVSSKEADLRFFSFTRYKNLLSGSFCSVVKSKTDKKVLYTHLIPWEISVWFSSISVKCGNQAIDAKIRSTPAVLRKSPTLIEIEFEVKAHLNCQVSFEFEKSFLYANEYPPDSNHGITVSGAVLTLTDSPSTRYYAEPTVITLPSPDVTMPYNVVCFIGTFGALIFQIVFTFTTQYQTIIKPGPSRIRKLIGRIKETINKAIKS
ncbi:unnamed protein product [Bursaphelenchus okinawaensis]|uniref:GPI transamidase component PIG-T n=1 Tax=Bursaphelenchus okinawaensis TaxID=465554 RepID=A0A811KJ65_9BILA|nr:unnamed protein product [Bursaphelenchus okinawaensis]CAG9103976.1 unnamed protein product [Bursaphelenchus okinawaensis]